MDLYQVTDIPVDVFKDMTNARGSVRMDNCRLGTEIKRGAFNGLERISGLAFRFNNYYDTSLRTSYGTSARASEASRASERVRASLASEASTLQPEMWYMCSYCYPSLLHARSLFFCRSCRGRRLQRTRWFGGSRLASKRLHRDQIWAF